MRIFDEVYYCAVTDVHTLPVILIEIKKREEGSLEEKHSVTSGFSPDASRTHSIVESSGALSRVHADHTRYFLRF